MRRSAALTWVARQIGDRGIVNFIQAPDFPSQRPAHCLLALGNVGGSPTPGNHTAETGLAGWGARIRTWEWRNQNPQEAFDMQRLSGLMLHLCLMRQGVLAVPPPILAMIPSAPF